MPSFTAAAWLFAVMTGLAQAQTPAFFPPETPAKPVVDTLFVIAGSKTARIRPSRRGRARNTPRR